jgi:hypothetical protein
MNWYDWNETARGLARQVRQCAITVERGAVPLRLVDETARPPRFIDDGPLVLGVFGKDNYLTDARTRRAVELLRQRIKMGEGRELGFGVSEDGLTWALLVGADRNRYKTAPGRALQRELLKIFLEEALTCAWQNAAEEPSAAAPSTSDSGQHQGLALRG